MDDNIRLQQMISGIEGAYQNQLALQQREEQQKEQLQQVEGQGGILGLFEAKKALLKKFKDKVSEKIEEGAKKINDKVNDKIDEVSSRAQEALEQPREAVQQIAERVQPEAPGIAGDIEMQEMGAPVVQGLSHIREGDSLADIARNPDKFNEFVKDVESPDTEQLFSSMGKDMNNDEHIEEVRNSIRDIVDSPEGARQEALAEEMNNKVPFPRGATAEQPQEFVSPEITGGLRGDSTIARMGAGRTAGEATGEGSGEEAGEAVGEAVGEGAGEVAGEAVGTAISAIPGLDLLAPIVFLGTAIASIFGHKKTPKAPVVHNFSAQFGA